MNAWNAEQLNPTRMSEYNKGDGDGERVNPTRMSEYNKETGMGKDNGEMKTEKDRIREGARELEWERECQRERARERVREKELEPKYLGWLNTIIKSLFPYISTNQSNGIVLCLKVMPFGSSNPLVRCLQLNSAEVLLKLINMQNKSENSYLFK